MTTAQQWFTVDEAASYLRISKRTVYKLSQTGRLAVFLIGNERHRRFRREDLDKVPQPASARLRDKRPAALTAEESPLLAELWDNELDAIYDTL